MLRTLSQPAEFEGIHVVGADVVGYVHTLPTK